MLVVNDSNRSEVKAALVRGLKPHFGDLSDLIPEKLLWTSKKGSIMVGGIGTSVDICLVRGKFISANGIDSPEKLERELFLTLPACDYQYTAAAVEQLRNGILPASSIHTAVRIAECSNENELLCREVISLLYREPPDDPQLLENLQSRFLACDIRLAIRKKNKINLHIKGRSIPKPDQFLFDEFTFFAGTAARNAGLKIPDETAAAAVEAARSEHEKFIREVGELPVPDVILDGLLRRRDKRYPGFYAALREICGCPHDAGTLGVEFGANGYDVSCRRCSFKVAYHPNRGVQVYPVFNDNPRLDTFLWYVSRAVKMSSVGKTVRESCAEVSEQMMREMESVRSGIHPLVRHTSTVRRALQKVEEFYDDTCLGFVDFDDTLGRCRIGGEILPETGVTPEILLAIFRKLLDDCRKKAESITRQSQSVMSLTDMAVILQAVRENSKKFGVGTFVLLLSGSKSKRLDELDLLQSRWYGALKQYRQGEIKQAIEWLRGNGLLGVTYRTQHELPVLFVPEPVTKVFDSIGSGQDFADPLLNERIFLQAVDGGDMQTVREFCEKDFAFALYLKAAEILVPKGKDAKLAKAVFAE